MKINALILYIRVYKEMFRAILKKKTSYLAAMQCRNEQNVVFLLDIIVKLALK